MASVAARIVTTLAVAALVACELVDPLDDISDGTRPAYKVPADASSDGTPAPPDDVPTRPTTSSSSSSSSASSSSSSGAVVPPTPCNGNSEQEPNDQAPGKLLAGTTCGVLSTSQDVDQLEFTSTTAKDGIVVLQVTTDGDIEYVLVQDQQKTQEKANGPPQTIQLGANGTFTVVLSTPLTPPVTWQITVEAVQ